MTNNITLGGSVAAGATMPVGGFAPIGTGGTLAGRNSGTSSPSAQRARDEIERHLAGTGPGGAQTGADDRAIVAILHGLSSADATATIADLDRSGKLGDVAFVTTKRSLGWPPLAAGDSVLSAGERTAFFADMAGKLDGQTLAALTRAYGAIDANPGRKADGVAGRIYAQELGNAIAAHASPQARVKFVRALAGDTTDPAHAEQSESAGGGFAVYQGTPAAVAVGEVLSSLRGRPAQDAFDAMSHEQQAAVMHASIGEHRQMAPNGLIVSKGYNTGLFSEIAAALASMPSVHQRAQAIAVGAQIIRDERVSRGHLGGNKPETTAAQNDMARGLAQIMDTDPAGIVSDLRRFTDAARQPGDVATNEGDALATYARQMMEMGDQGKGILGVQIARVAAGDGRSKTLGDAFNAKVGREYPTAQNIGYLLGAVQVGANGISEDYAARNQVIADVFQLGLTAIDKSGGKMSATAASFGKDLLGRLANAMLGGAENPYQTLESQLTPVDKDGYSVAGADAYSAMNASLGTVTRNAES